MQLEINSPYHANPYCVSDGNDIFVLSLKLFNLNSSSSFIVCHNSPSLKAAQTPEQTLTCLDPPDAIYTDLLTENPLHDQKGEHDINRWVTAMF